MSFGSGVSGGGTGSGPAGDPGKSAYQVAVDNGFVGTQAQWLAALKGADGSQGLKGDKGDKGDQGNAGSRGNDGSNGVDGKTAYELAVIGGFVGTQAEWIASLKGAKGDKGDQGNAGTNGSDGAAGKTAYELAVLGGYAGTQAQWLASLKGADGAQGPQGNQGIQGVQGNAGNDGTPGSAGVDGKTVRNGSGVPAPGLGVDGDFYIDTTNNNVYGPKTAGAWGSATSLVGNSSLTQLAIFGSGSDGDLTSSSGTLNINRDMFYRNVTLSGTAKLSCAGYRIFVSGILDISAAGADAINNNATAANPVVGSTSGASGSIPGQQAEVGPGGTCTTSAAGSIGVGNKSSNPTSPNPAQGGYGGAAGAGGASGTGNAGGAQTGSTSSFYGNTSFRRLDVNLLRGATFIYGGSGAAGGSSGGGDGTNTSNGGAPGGAGGGVVFVAARTINRGASTAVGTIAAKGANGGTFSSNVTTGNCGGYGGGGGGGGGWIYLVYQNLTGATGTNILSVDGGDGSTGGNGAGTGKGGAGGNGGMQGRISIFDLGADTNTEPVVPTAQGANATVPTTSAGSAGTSGATGRASL